MRSQIEVVSRMRARGIGYDISPFQLRGGFSFVSGLVFGVVGVLWHFPSASSKTARETPGFSRGEVRAAGR